MRESLRSAAAVVAALVVVGVGGYFAVTQLGWETTIEMLGFEITAVVRAPESQCAQAQEYQTEDEAVMCIADRRWMREYIERCAEGEEPDLVYIASDGVLTRLGKCPPRQQRSASRQRDVSIPADVRVAEIMGTGN
jgi:hypothetical protein